MNKNVLKNLESLPFFTNVSILAYEDVKPKALYQNIYRWVNSGLIIRLKNGLYVTKTFVDRSIYDRSYLELIANKLVMPSYLSLEYVLQKHGLLTEATFVISSVTIKSTRRYTNKLGAFFYFTMGEKLYFDFETHGYGKNIIYEASKSKALFDYMYLRLAALNPKDISTIVELRINWSNLGRSDFQAFREIIKKSGIKKMIQMIHLFEEVYDGETA